ncbi:hypothetical protein SH668x_001125 [Planctomicrobium sp. SH668]|uniref:hypothetical protein n=1 Tax=Planctomicrobium sp. SH668 TaxID=3448126 RepID=UPI003F5C5DDB
MGAKIASFLATLLLSIPLAAIGLMAIFGIPQLVPANGAQSSTRDNVMRNVQDAFNWTQSPQSDAPQHITENQEDAPLHKSGHRNNSDAFPPSNSRNLFETSSRQESSNSPFEESAAAWENQRPQVATASASNSSPFANESRQPFAMSSDSSSKNSSPISNNNSPFSTSSKIETSRNDSLEAGSPLLTWRQASLRLSELGVKNFHLEKGVGEGSFLFVCVFSPGDAPHIVHRFESEAEDPLLAVNQTLQQVDKWMRTRYAASNFPSRSSNLTLTAGSQSR